MKKKEKLFSDQIRPLRDEIDRIDSDILSLLARRQEQVEKVVALKKACDMPVFHPAREEDMISRLRNQAKEKGLDPDVTENLFRVIIRQSRVKQTFRMQYKGVRPGAAVLIIGGAGQMGAMFASLFEKSGYRVRILTESDWENASKLCAGIDLALVSVPIEKTVGVIEKIAPLLPPQALLADLTSVKHEPVTAMCRRHTGPVLGIHPLFGPSTTSLDKQIIVITPGRDLDSGHWLVEQLGLWGAILVQSTPGEHDEIMEIVQALRHFATFCFGRFLFEQQVKIQRTLEFSSPIYRLELGMVGRLFAQDAGLYAQIIFATKERRELLKQFITSLNQHLDMLENKDTRTFVRQFNEIAQWFGPFSDQALRESTFLIDRLIERF
ncbi:MAG: bifunctional chorismate mutase/prephenate dehydrogenase [Desulfotignum sp.]|nr:bifunctional chorismate mutase/prephenate dehydrogenase [Desulfotignum sp.]MCF8112593.1 bifunctional chorismate mutase/prephenate dehydrogenase [Desulfotignum sp.]MCF8124933.1 bifunctional chorismate mutase/prephenate dehydrogenase [Desulfotignum sp.]